MYECKTIRKVFNRFMDGAEIWARQCVEVGGNYYL